MNATGDAGSRVWADAALAATLCAIDPAGLGGIVLRARAGPVRDRWVGHLRGHLPASMPIRTVPLHIGDSRLLGGLDLTATLRAGRPVAEQGLLAEVHGGIALLAMAERVSGATAARITSALDRGEIQVERDGLALRIPARFGVIALDEGAEPDERPPAALLDRLAFHVDLEGVPLGDATASATTVSAVENARSRLPRIVAGDDVLQSLTATAMALGIASLRAVHLALRASRALAALAQRDAVEAEDAAIAGRLVFAARATQLPSAPSPDAAEAQDTVEDSRTEAEQDGDPFDRPLDDMVLEAIKAALPAALLAQLVGSDGVASRGRSGGKAGASHRSKLRGRPVGTRAGEPRGGARLSVVETLRSAAPWQPLRRRESGRTQSIARIDVRPEDFRVKRYEERSQSTTIFVVDASGSSALHRLAEAKGAVELLLAESYVRRDQVALIAFRGERAEVLLPPTRSLVRAKRSLAGLPGGGGTPLASGIDAALALADGLRRKGETPSIVVLTDGKANVARDGKPGREQATADAAAAARRLRVAAIPAIVLDTSPRPQPQAEQLARDMGARYVPLPHADANAVTRAVRAAAPDPG
ncbi:MAG: magnesium chelatase subunit D [Burkholderiales bacterium]|nr:magnesium chelatase subunit D [Burkholderiales bacterium]